MRKFVINNKVLISYGTRPELIKLSPLIRELDKRGIVYKTVFTGQHKQLYEDVKELVPEPDYCLSIMRDDQTPVDIVANIALKFAQILRVEKPDLLIVQGDTSTVAASALIAFYEKIPIGHVEAGLRTYNLTSPFPEEGNRQIVSRLARFNWAPTELSAQQLRNEKVENVYVTGNTVIDACMNYKYKIKYTNKVLITLHRRENFGKKMEKIVKEINWLAEKHPGLNFIFPMHPNPNVQKIKHLVSNINIVKPMGYPEMMRLLSEVKFVISDSGGIQEECAAFRKKVLVCRDTTERPEGINVGLAKLVGTDIVENFNWANNNPHWEGKNPYGNGDASSKIIDSFF